MRNNAWFSKYLIKIDNSSLFVLYDMSLDFTEIKSYFSCLWVVLALDGVFYHAWMRVVCQCRSRNNLSGYLFYFNLYQLRSQGQYRFHVSGYCIKRHMFIVFLADVVVEQGALFATFFSIFVKLIDNLFFENLVSCLFS